MTRAWLKPHLVWGLSAPKSGPQSIPVPDYNSQPEAIMETGAPDPSFSKGKQILDLDCVFSYLIFPSPSCPFSAWGQALLLALKHCHVVIKNSKSSPSAWSLSPEGGSKEPALQGRDEVSHWQDLLRSQDGSLCQGLFVCLQERLIWHTTKIVLRLGPRACLFQCC